jgi:hypothetical protein
MKFAMSFPNFRSLAKFWGLGSGLVGFGRRIGSRIPPGGQIPPGGRIIRSGKEIEGGDIFSSVPESRISKTVANELIPIFIIVRNFFEFNAKTRKMYTFAH